MEHLKKLLEEKNLSDIDNKMKKFEKYRSNILEWNKKVNITAITNEEEFEIKHYIDSLLCISSSEIEEATTIVDIGTGGGFPGVPLAIVFPEKKFVLVDSLKKRLKIIDQITEEIEINNVETIHGRAEELTRKKEFRETFDVCVSRAVANLSTLSEYCLPFVKIGGSFISYKGPGGKEELEKAQKAIALLGGKVNRCDISEGQLGMEHQLIYIDKIKATGKKFPRGAGKPTKDPL